MLIEPLLTRNRNDCLVGSGRFIDEPVKRSHFNSGTTAGSPVSPQLA